MAIDLRTFDPQPISASMADLQIGVRLGLGGQKAVWDCNFHARRYVLKVLAADSSTTERAKREIEVYRRCNSPYLPRVGPLPLASMQVGADPSDVILYYLEEHIDGSTLQQIPKPMAMLEVIALAKCISSAIEVLWSQGFVHRDIKPANIVRKINTQEFVKFVPVALTLCVGNL